MPIIEPPLPEIFVAIWRTSATLWRILRLVSAGYYMDFLIKCQKRASSDVVIKKILSLRPEERPLITENSSLRKSMKMLTPSKM
jgi:hypothetical protein